MHKSFLLLIIFLTIFLFSATTSFANTNSWGGTIATGQDGCHMGAFNTCYDKKASCLPDGNDANGNAQGKCIVTTSKNPPTRDICEGYDANDSTHTVQTGICYYSIDDTMPSCSELTGNDYHQDSDYHKITDEIQPCHPNLGKAVQCCAPKLSKQVPVAPPPPCVLDKDGKCNQVTTALGSLKVDPGTVVGSIFGILLSLSGGIAVVIIIISGYNIMFSHADPEKLKSARESLTSAIIGLLFIIFSVAILRVIGVTLLHIPGLNQ